MEYLSLEDLAAIATAIADGQPFTVANLARRLGRSLALPRCGIICPLS
jgi:hypothetical protein